MVRCPQHVAAERRGQRGPCSLLFIYLQITPNPNFTAFFMICVAKEKKKSFKLLCSFCILLETQFGNANIISETHF